MAHFFQYKGTFTLWLWWSNDSNVPHCLRLPTSSCAAFGLIACSLNRPIFISPWRSITAILPDKLWQGHGRYFFPKMFLIFFGQKISYILTVTLQKRHLIVNLDYSTSTSVKNGQTLTSVKFDNFVLQYGNNTALRRVSNILDLAIKPLNHKHIF